MKRLDGFQEHNCFSCWLEIGDLVWFRGAGDYTELARGMGLEIADAAVYELVEENTGRQASHEQASHGN